MANLREVAEHISAYREDQCSVLTELRDTCEELARLTEIFDPEEISSFDYDTGYYSCKLEYKIDYNEFDLELLNERRRKLKEANSYEED